MGPKTGTAKTKVNPLAEIARKRVENAEREKAEREAEEAEAKRIQDEEDRKYNEEQDRIREEQALKREKKEAKIRRQKEEGTYKTEAEKKKAKRIQEGMSRGYATHVKERADVEEEEVVEKRPDSIYRSPIICVMGHVDTGKTKLLDYIRSSSIQTKEVGGITQQIGASFKSRDDIDNNEDINVPGLLFIDTPGHSAFGNLRRRGTSICDLVILVVDLMKGIERQTRESMDICFSNGVPFIIALNKIDRLYGWDASDERPVFDKLRDEIVKDQYASLLENITKEFWNLELNPILFTEYSDEDSNEDTLVYVPVSAITGEGVQDLLHEAALYCQTRLEKRILLVEGFNATIMESKKGANGENSIDLILVSGTLRIGDLIGISTLSGPVKTHVRALMLPEEGEEMRMANSYKTIKKVIGSCGVKILAPNIEDAIPGTPVFKLDNEDESFDYFESKIVLADEGIAVFAPTLGQLEALITHLSDECDPPIPVSIAGVGNVYRKNILSMSKFASRNLRRYLYILCFDVNVNEDARSFAAEEGITIYYDQTIYRLSEKFRLGTAELELERLNMLRVDAKIPFELTIDKRGLIRAKDPIIVLVKVRGELRNNTIVCDQNGLELGTITGIQHNSVALNLATNGMEVTIALNTKFTFGRQITNDTKIYPKTTRDSLDILKNNFRSEINSEMVKIINIIKASQNIK